MKKLLAVLFAAMISCTMLIAQDAKDTTKKDTTKKETVKKTHKAKKTTEEKK